MRLKLRWTYHNHVQQVGSKPCSCTQRCTAPFSSEYSYALHLLGRRGEVLLSLMYFQPDTVTSSKLQSNAVLLNKIHLIWALSSTPGALIRCDRAMRRFAKFALLSCSITLRLLKIHSLIAPFNVLQIYLPPFS